MLALFWSNYNPFTYKPINYVNVSDPEEKYGPGGFDLLEIPVSEEQRFIKSDLNNDLDYRIEIYNNYDATAPVQEAFLRDTLDDDFDLTTFNFNEFGFRDWTVPVGGGQYIDLNIDMRPTENLIVNAIGEFDQATRAMAWTFRSLDPVTMELPLDPQAGFLPAIDTLNWHDIAWVEYSIKPKAGLASGTRLENTVWSNFDNVGGWLNAPKYGPWVNTLDGDLPEGTMIALEQESREEFEISCTGSDTTSLAATCSPIRTSCNI